MNEKILEILVFMNIKHVTHTGSLKKKRFYLKLYKCIIVKHIAHTTLIFVYGILIQERKDDIKSSFEDLHAT